MNRDHRYWFSRSIFSAGQALCALGLAGGAVLFLLTAFSKEQPVPLRGQPYSEERMASIREDEARSTGRRMDLIGSGWLMAGSIVGWASLAVFVAVLDASSHIQTLRNVTLPDPRPSAAPVPLAHLLTPAPQPPSPNPTRPGSGSVELHTPTLIDLDAEDAKRAAAMRAGR